ncbi:O-acetyltransferase OatA [compost metagenome]
MIKPLTSLRFFFAFMVLLSHIPYKINHIFYHLISNGAVGVSFFFILSGFILTLNYEERISNGYQKRKFLIDRFLRIYPLHLLVLTIFALSFLLGSMNRILLLKQFVSHFFLIQNYIPIKEIYSSLNKPAWSICCEMFFYLCFPFLVLRIKKNLIISLLFLILIPFLIFYINRENSLFLGINPFIRIPDFIVGILSYRLYKALKPYVSNISSSHFSIIEVILILFLFLSFYSFYGLNYYQTFPLYWIPMVFFIIGMGFSNGLIAKILSKSPFVILGEISYSIYMTHFFIIHILTTFFRDTFAFENRFTFLICVSFITISCSYLTYTLIEMKFSKHMKPHLYKLLNVKQKGLS